MTLFLILGEYYTLYRKLSKIELLYEILSEVGYSLGVGYQKTIAKGFHL